MADTEKMMGRIAALIAKAESTAEQYPEEAAAYTAKAEELMRLYRIKESQLESADGPVMPIYREVHVAPNGEWASQQHWLWEAIASHAGVRYDTTAVTQGDGSWNFVARTVGYDVDIRLAEMLFNSARLAFLFALAPEFNPAETPAQNIYRMRSAGMDRQLIAEKVFGKRGHSQGLKVGQLYREECARRGEAATVSGRDFNAKTYREVYAREFVYRVESRLRRARFAADAVPGLMVSVSRPLAVEEAFYTRFPSRRPKPVEETTESKCEGSGKPAKTKALSKATEARLERLYYGPTAVAARRTARKAADSIALGRETTQEKRVAPGDESSPSALGS